MARICQDELIAVLPLFAQRDLSNGVAEENSIGGAADRKDLEPIRLSAVDQVDFTRRHRNLLRASACSLSQEAPAFRTALSLVGQHSGHNQGFDAGIGFGLNGGSVEPAGVETAVAKC